MSNSYIDFIDIMKKHEKRLLILMVTFIMLTICIVLYMEIINVNNNDDYNVYYDGNLKVIYNISMNGVDDNISLDNNNISGTDNFKKNEYSFKINNLNTKKSKYKIILEIDNSMIKLDDCKDKLVNYDAIRYSVDNGKTKKLSLEKNNKFIIDIDNLKGNESIKHILKIWIDKNSMIDINNHHFHCRIIVKSI